MKCPTCSAAELVRDTRDWSFTYEGKTAVIPELTGDHCPACGVVVMDPGEAKRYNDVILDLGFSAWLEAPGLTHEYLAYRKEQAEAQAKAAAAPRKGRKPKDPAPAPATLAVDAVSPPKPNLGSQAGEQLTLI